MIKTGINNLNKLIRGYKREITMIYGGAATGKTTFCLICALDLANKGDRVLFVDTENSFSVERSRQIKENFNYLTHNIFVFKINNFKQQKTFFDRLEDMIKNGNFSTLIIDTLSMYYRKELNEDAYKANREMDREFVILKKIAKKIPVIITSQVYSNLEGGIMSVGGEMFRNKCGCLIELRKNEHRELEIKKPIKHTLNFKIVNEGIEINQDL